jgi:hypothetical protein
MFDARNVIQDECKKHESSPDKCIDLYKDYREKYKWREQSIHLVSVFMLSHLIKAQRYKEAIQESMVYIDSGKSDDSVIPIVLYWKAMANFGLGEKEEGTYLLLYVQEKYPLSLTAEAARKMLLGKVQTPIPTIAPR